MHMHANTLVHTLENTATAIGTCVGTAMLKAHCVLCFQDELLDGEYLVAVQVKQARCMWMYSSCAIS